MTSTRPTVDVAIPTGSSGCRCSERDSGTSAMPTTRPSTTTGTLSRNTQPHQKRDSIHPPSVGPSGSARKFAAA
ncbi:MAG: hypothetical protein AUG49_07200 [Catenulispora sp. 13_1_20CM_3_70_7]|nr:MAG: hypothetical protein AUG49_07200 [Catenulispora sp. 13_1_20CM_3_70_7]